MTFHFRSNWRPLACGALLFAVLLSADALAVDRQSPPVVAVAADTKQIAIASDIGVVIREVATKREQAILPVPVPKLTSLQIRDGWLWAAGGVGDESGWVGRRRWPVESGDAWQAMPAMGLGDVAYAIAFDPKGERLAVASLDGSAVIVAVPSGRLLRRLEGHSAGVTAVCWCRRDFLVTASLDRTIRVWDAKSGSRVRTLSNHTAPVVGLAMRPGERKLPQMASIGADRTIRLWQPTIGRMMRFVRLERAVPTCLAWLHESGPVVVGTDDGRLLTIDPDTATLLTQRPIDEDWVTSIAPAPSGWLFVGTARGKTERLAIGDLQSDR